jgi:LuxR family maltose regulon positive regulatory protein
MSRVEGALRHSVREGLDGLGIAPAPAKLYPPAPGIVPRSALADRVRAARPDLVTVTAPAGYGKSTFVAELAADDPRPTAWVSLTAVDNDPASLLTYVALALDGIEPVDPSIVSTLWLRPPTIGTPGLQHFTAMVAERDDPFVLVLDDAHELTNRDALDVLPELVSAVPTESTIVLTSRATVPLRLGRLRVRRRVAEVGLADLAFDVLQATLLLEHLGIVVPQDDVARLVARTEGWPVAVYLAGLAHGTKHGADLVADFTGDHRYLAEYLGEELLGTLDPDIAAFLMEASCLERVSGDLCDAVLDRTGSASVLEAVQRRNLLVIPVDDRRQWYRFHHLMSEFLQAELIRRDPVRRVEIHRRASDWCHAGGDADGAVTHALLAGDLARAESMVMHWFSELQTTGHYSTTERWLSKFPSDALSSRPALMVIAALGYFSGGEPGAARRWLDRAGEVVTDRHPPDAIGRVAPVLMSTARATIEPMPVSEMVAEARYGYEHIGSGDGRPLACLAYGAASFMLGDDGEAMARLREGATTTLHRPIVVATCLAHLAALDVEHGRWDDAADAVEQARALLLDDLIRLPIAALALAVSALVETRRGSLGAAEADRLLCRQHLIRLLHLAPWLNLQARIALARAAVIRGDRVEAAALTDEAEVILGSTPGAVRIEAQLAALRRSVVAADTSAGFGPASLTTAELRVLQLLPTHLTIGEIADRMYVSRNTVKSQTIAIYRKLGTSSRGGAVQIAAAAGLLDTAARTD